MRLLKFLSLSLCFLVFNCDTTSKKTNSVAVSVSFSDEVNNQSLDGRLLLVFADNNKSEPRFQVNEGLNAQPVFGMNIDDLTPNEKVIFDESISGFPYQSLADMTPGKYYVQAVLHTYETFNLSTGHTVKLPMDNGEGQKWNRSPGNLYSTPFEVEVTENGLMDFEIVMDNVIPEIVPPEDTEWIKHITMKSDLLSEFWGRDMYLGAHVLLPKGFNEHPESKYPLMVFQGHFPSDFGGFRTTPPDENLESVYSARFDLDGYNIIQQHGGSITASSLEGQGSSFLITLPKLM